MLSSLVLLSLFLRVIVIINHHILSVSANMRIRQSHAGVSSDLGSLRVDRADPVTWSALEWTRRPLCTPSRTSQGETGAQMEVWYSARLGSAAGRAMEPPSPLHSLLHELLISSPFHLLSVSVCDCVCVCECMWGEVLILKLQDTANTYVTPYACAARVSSGHLI